MHHRRIPGRRRRDTLPHPRRYTPDEVPDVQGVLINAAKRASSAAAGIVQSQSVNGSSVTYNVSLMADELAKLDRYKLGALP